MKHLITSIICLLGFVGCENITTINGVDINNVYVYITHACSTQDRYIDSARIYNNGEYLLSIAQCENISFIVKRNDKLTAKYNYYTIEHYFVDSVINGDTTDLIPIVKTDTIQKYEKIRNFIITADTTKWSLFL